MIDSIELRQNNFIFYTDEVVQVDGFRPPIKLETKYRIYFKDGRAKPNGGFIKPIPITEDWLIRFGFFVDISEDIFNGPVYVFDDKGIKYNFLMSFKTLQPIDGAFDLVDYEVKYVHQLQNIFFFKTGKELY